MDDGVSFVNFRGHGGGGIWADGDGILQLNEVEDLNNTDKYPFIASMTCFTGSFENPIKEGLAEKVLMEAEKGAIAVLASSSVAWTYNDFAIEWNLFDGLWEEHMTFGQAVDYMKIMYLSNPIYYTESILGTTPGWFDLYRSMVHQYNLLGDPTLKIQKPAQKLAVSLSNKAPGAGELVKIKIESPLLTAAGSIEISDQQNRKFFESTFALNGSRTEIDFNVPSISPRVLNVKVYVTDGSSDAAGNATMAVKSSAVSEITIIPENPQVNQLISFQAILKTFSPIVSAQLRNFRNFNQATPFAINIPLQAVNDTLYESTRDFPGFPGEGLKYFQVYIKDEQGREYVYDLNKIQVGDSRPDLILDNQSIAYGGIDQLYLQFKVKNDSDNDLNDVKIEVFDENGIATNTPFYSDSLVFLAHEDKTIKIEYNPAQYSPSRLFRIKTDPENKIEERNEQNNQFDKILLSNYYGINYQIGSSNNGVLNDTIKASASWQYYLAPNALSSSSVIHFRNIDISTDLESNSQKDLKYIRLKNDTDSSAVQFALKNSAASFNQPALLIAEIDTSYHSSEILNYVSIFKYNPFSNIWVKIPSLVDKDFVSAPVNSGGMYAVFSFRDEKDPLIEITANGRPLRDESLIRANPTIAFLIQDDNGIDFENSFRVTLNNSDLNREELIYPDTLIDANSIAVHFMPQLNQGVHNLSVSAADINGNLVTQNITFAVSNNNELTIFGNYPNPFTEKTIISYRNDFSDKLEKLSVRIYSVSGHLVRKEMLPAPFDVEEYEDLLETGYHELEWDGTDDSGTDVANGVYFVVVKAKFTDPFTKKEFNISKRLKVARLK